jgi:hypothetical protein
MTETRQAKTRQLQPLKNTGMYLERGIEFSPLTSVAAVSAGRQRNLCDSERVVERVYTDRLLPDVSNLSHRRCRQSR